MKRRITKRRTDRHTPLRIDVGLLILPTLGDEKIAADFSRQGILPKTIHRVLNDTKQRRPTLPEAETGDRRLMQSNKPFWASMLDRWL